MTAAKTAMLAVSKKMAEEVDNTRRSMQINLEFFEEIWMLSLVKIILIMSDIVCVLPFATQIYTQLLLSFLTTSQGGATDKRMDQKTCRCMLPAFTSEIIAASVYTLPTVPTYSTKKRKEANIAVLSEFYYW